MYATFDQLFDTIRYPAGETHVALRAEVALPAPGEALVIEAEARGFEALGRILTADRILRHQRRTARWFLPYFPFARHDRRIDGRDGLELELALDWVRELDVTIADPHSDVAGRLRHVPQTEVVAGYRRAGAFAGDPIVVIPDAGATKKALEWVGDAEVVQASKRRDPRTGRLSGFEIDLGGREDLAGRPCLIVDDICDGGGTFLGLAAALEAKGAGPLTLAVTHGLFTQGMDALFERFERVFHYGPEAGVERVLREGDEGPVECARHTLAWRDLYEKGETR